MSQRQFPVLLTLQQITRIVNLLKGQSQELSAAIDALNAPNVEADARLYRKLTRLQDEIVEDSLE
jgi:hypothetical protein